MSTALAVQIDGLYVPLTECDWVMFKGCGCAVGVGLAALGGSVYGADEDADGYRLELMTHRRCCDGPLKQLTEPCPHQGLDVKPAGALL